MTMLWAEFLLYGLKCLLFLVLIHCTEYSQSRLSTLYSGFVETVFSYVLRWFHTSILGASMARITPPQALERFCVYSLRWVITAVWLVFHSPFSHLPRNLKQTIIHRPLLPFTTINGRPCFSQSPNCSKLTSPQFLNLSPPPPIPSHPPLPHRNTLHRFIKKLGDTPRADPVSAIGLRSM